MPKLSTDYISKRLPLSTDCTLVLALSGGLDSMVLLDLLQQAREQYGFGLHAVYVHHGLSPNASDWGAFCAKQCTLRQVAFTQCQVQLQGSDNLEHKARQARYQALAEFVSSDKHYLLTAHHSDDQLETLLLALKRGAGAAGLAGIAARRDFANGHLLRPLLDCSRKELEQYARQQGLAWIEDESNSDTRFERNFIRQQLTPLITERWPTFSRTAARSMQHVTQLQQLADHYTQMALAQCVENQTLKLDVLAGFIPLQQDLVLRLWLKQAGLNPETLWLNTLKRDVIAARDDASPVLVLADYQLRRFNHRLYLLGPADVTVPEGEIFWQDNQALQLPNGCGSLVKQDVTHTDAGLALPSGELQVVFGKLSLRFKPFDSPVSKPLKQWFKLWQVPPWQRLQTPLLLQNEQLVAVAGYASSLAPEQAPFRLSWQNGTC